MQGVKQLRAGEYPHYTGPGAPVPAGGIRPQPGTRPTSPADMYLFFYAAIDLMAETLHPTTTLDEVSVNGFLHGRPT